ncbi:amino acid adenylation domain-containing protein [Nonomuraea sp. PA05]|uniref:amino acid adenylation domain-containing protein n=1 Tax=Nonomuraea sp. PA05 TaxID=2604466 RepID=UPI0011DA1A20|nr:amino acid adenylation domain-containing protein [Nonomuraea sp. PA05]TYB62203.1 amino acid adenylation domain-containing protein [Nonomuraea sp. PA05]
MNASPLTPAQQANWLGRLPAFELGGSAARHYLEAEVQDLDLARYGEAWRQAIQRHPALRTVITGDGQQQILTDVPAYEPQVEDLRTSTEATGRLEAIRADMTTQAFDPTRWPLFEVRVSRLDERRSRVHVAVDLLVADADGFALLGEEIFTGYQGHLSEAVTETDAAPAAPAARAGTAPAGATAALPPQLPLAIEPRLLAQPLCARRERRLPAPHWLALREHATDLTPTAVLACALNQALAAWSKEPRFTLAYASRDRHPRAVGDFTDLTFLDVDADPRIPFQQQAHALQAQLNQNRPDGLLILREIARTTGQLTAALAPVLFCDRLNSPTGDGWALGLGRIGFTSHQRPQVQLAHEVREEHGDLVLVWDAIDALFPGRVLEDLIDAHLAFLQQLATDPGAWQRTARDWLPAQQHRVRDQVNAASAAIPPLLLHEPFWAQAARTPDAPAVISDSRTLTYRQLRAGATALGARLRELGARPNTTVAVVMDKGWEQPLAVFGILESGAAYVPIEPDLPAERLHYLLKHAEVKLALTQQGLEVKLPWPQDVTPMVIDESLLDGDGASEPSRLQSHRDLAYIIYTSGSTGLPKGVMIDHRGALNTVLDINRRFHVTAADRMLTLTPLTFDLSVYDLFGPFAHGGALVMPEAGTGRAPWSWADLIERHDVTLWNTVPALMEMLLGYTQGRRQRLAPTLRLVLMSGDWIPVTLPGRIRSLADHDIDIISLGGATEASIWSIWHRIDTVDSSLPSIPYGKPLTNQHFEILDEALRRRPDWVPGEQYVGGYGVAMGYWRDPDKSARAFITHPTTGRRLYRTGDLGRYFPDGSIEFLGREDFQVKINGYRIELGEIEAALLDHDAVTGAVVTAIGARRGEKRLVAYATPAGTIDSDELIKTLRDHLAEKLPSHMLPGHIIILDALPLTRNGKVDRRALPAPITTPSAATESAEPADGLESALLAIWRKVAGEQITLTDDYSVLNPLDIVRAHHAITRILAPQLSLDELFRHTTIRALARRLAASR